MKENFYSEITKNQEMVIPQIETTTNILLVQTRQPCSVPLVDAPAVANGNAV